MRTDQKTDFLLLSFIINRERTIYKKKQNNKNSPGNCPPPLDKNRSKSPNTIISSIFAKLH